MLAPNFWRRAIFKMDPPFFCQKKISNISLVTYNIDARLGHRASFVYAFPLSAFSERLVLLVRKTAQIFQSAAKVSTKQTLKREPKIGLEKLLSIWWHTQKKQSFRASAIETTLLGSRIAVCIGRASIRAHFRRRRTP